MSNPVSACQIVEASTEYEYDSEELFRWQLGDRLVTFETATKEEAENNYYTSKERLKELFRQADAYGIDIDL